MTLGLIRLESPIFGPRRSGHVPAIKFHFGGCRSPELQIGGSQAEIRFEAKFMKREMLLLKRVKTAHKQ